MEINPIVELSPDQISDLFDYVFSYGKSTGTLAVPAEATGADEYVMYVGIDCYSVYCKDGRPVAASDNLSLIHRVLSEVHSHG
ncbi:ribulokinase (plasmid) [Yersinia similis]|uniref:Ribulokinase n=1 Tax=Yersinia similis TaxID=367190 RepID=A0ABM5Q417_9GAMM|nr:ribulokinase [Yersinia similis]CFQ66837.1 Uncharacterised protein [Yersinia similis]CNB81669.1 Uncharacterised protein [Yersinia similis]